MGAMNGFKTITPGGMFGNPGILGSECANSISFVSWYTTTNIYVVISWSNSNIKRRS
jgi:hypothetical protein